MGTVIRFRNVRFVVFTADHRPAHVHAVAPGAEAKIEIASLRVVWSHGYRKADLARIVEQVRIHKRFLLEAWREIHEDQA
jgi:hypothetical protein